MLFTRKRCNLAKAGEENEFQVKAAE